MRIGVNGKRHYLNEYVFAQIISDYNTFVKNQTKSSGEASASPILVSQGVQLHDKVMARAFELAREKNSEAKQPTAASFVAAADEIMPDSMGGRKPFNGEEWSHSEYVNHLNAFKEITGFEKGKPSPADESHFLPISPYDPVFRNRYAVKLNGSKISYIRSNDIDSVQAVGHMASDAKVDVYPDAKIDEKGSHVVGNANKLSTPDDVSGLTTLMGYMSEREYQSCHEWATAGVDVDNPDSEENVQRRSDIDRSAKLLSGIRSMGRTYTISKDIRPGQLRARIDGTRVEVRVTDVPGSSYIGRVYDQGVVERFSTTRQASSNGSFAADKTDISPERSLDLVKLALGEPVARWDDPSKLVGEPDTYDVRRRNVVQTQNAVYHSTKTMTAVIGDYIEPDTRQPDRWGNKTTVMSETKSRSAMTTPMNTEDDAKAWLNKSISSARANLADSLDIDQLALAAEAYKRSMLANPEGTPDDSTIPNFSGEGPINVVQQSYWDVLTGAKKTLLIPGDAATQFEESIGDVGELDADEASEKERQLSYPVDENTDPLALVRQHAKDYVNDQIGTFEPDANGKRFNPVQVSTYMSGEHGQYRNNDDIVKALRILDIPAEELKGDEFYNSTIKSKLLKFDEASAKPLDDDTNPFMSHIRDVVKTSLKTNGVELGKDPQDLVIDDNGVIQYKGTYQAGRALTNRKGESVEQSFTGQIGQIFVPDDRGVFRTKFAGGDNAAYVPGYEAVILPQKTGENKSVEERTRLRGYEQVISDAIRYQVRQDMLTPNPQHTIGNPTSVNNAYRGLYAEKYALDFEQQYAEQGMPQDVLDSIIRTQSARVRYPNSIRDGSTINAAYRANNTYADVDMANDNFGDAYVLTGGRNMSVLTKESDGYFDPIATTATSTNQGIQRFLTTDAVVNPDGSITKGAEDGRCAIMAHPISKYSQFNPFDRQNMTLSNLMQASAVTEPVGIAQMTLGGWTMDDAMVVSKSFAQSHHIRKRDGSLRDMIVGDKISDFDGNKGVISLVVDPEMSDEDAKEQQLTDVVQWFRDNPGLDVVMAPFPAVSRYNGGTARELMDGVADANAQGADTSLIHRDKDGNEVKGAQMGIGRIIITDKTVDTKTHIYDEDEVIAGKGRKISAQLAWALNAQNCENIMKECYGANGSVLSNIREDLITCGLDMDETGRLTTGYYQQIGDHRKTIKMPELKFKAKGGLDMNAMDAEFSKAIERNGGFMPVPFDMKYPTGEPMQKNADGETLMPVMSSYLRSNQSFADGTSVTHDYTNQYLRVFHNAVDYQYAQLVTEQYEDAKKTGEDSDFTDREYARAKDHLVKCPQAAQAAYDSIAGDVKRRAFEGKHNVFRDALMSHRMPNSATAVWTPDPRLDIDQLAVGPAIADALNVEDGKYSMIFRDPVLRPNGLRYMKIKVDKALTGVAVNPAIDKPFDGDFDGDSVGNISLRSKEAREEAMEKLSVPANLLDYGYVNDEGQYDIGLQESLDIKVAEHHDPSIKESIADSRHAVNDIEKLIASGELSGDDAMAARMDLTQELSDTYRKALASTATFDGGAHVDYDSMENHLQSVWDSCITTGAKGSPSKMSDYATYLGVETKFNDKGVAGPVIVHENTLATREMNQGVMLATAIKSFGTGAAGRISQRGVEALRNVCPAAVLQLTYPVTQSILQAKHDPVDALHRYDMLMGPVRDLWRGRNMELDQKSGLWVPERDEHNKPRQATTEEWVKSFMNMYTSDNGLGVAVNPAYIDVVAKSLSKGGVMLNLESDDVPTASTMDKLAYEPKFEHVVEAAKNHADLFEGHYNEQFAPNVIRRNREASDLDRDEARELDRIGAGIETDATRAFKGFGTKADTQLEGHARKTNAGPKVSVGPKRDLSGLTARQMLTELGIDTGSKSDEPVADAAQEVADSTHVEDAAKADELDGKVTMGDIERAREAERRRESVSMPTGIDLSGAQAAPEPDPLSR